MAAVFSKRKPKKGLVKLRTKVSRGPTLDDFHLMQETLKALSNNVLKVTEVKGSTPKVEYDPGVLKVARASYGNKVMKWHTNASGTIVSNGSGAVVYSIGCALSLTAEGSGLAALFSEVKLVQSHIEVTPVALAASNNAATIFGFNPNGEDASTGAVATSTVVCLPNVFMVSNHAGQPTVSHSSLKLVNRAYDGTATDPSADPPAGCLGAWWVINRTTHSNSVTAYAYRLRHHVLLRNRL